MAAFDAIDAASSKQNGYVVSVGVFEKSGGRAFVGYKYKGGAYGALLEFDLWNGITLWKLDNGTLTSRAL